MAEWYTANIDQLGTQKGLYATDVDHLWIRTVVCTLQMETNYGTQKVSYCKLRPIMEQKRLHTANVKSLNNYGTEKVVHSKCRADIEQIRF